MAKRGMAIARAPLASREGRIEEHDARHQLRIEHIVDQFAIMRAQPAFGKGVTQQTRAPGIDIIEKEARAGEMGVYGQEAGPRSEEHTSELQSLMRISYAVFCLKKKKIQSTE